MSPFQIEILLYSYYSAEDNCPKKHAPIFNETISEFVRNGLIIEVPSQHPCIYTYKGNREALEAYVQALGAVPLPVQKWVVPNA